MNVGLFAGLQRKHGVLDEWKPKGTDPFAQQNRPPPLG